MLKKIVLIIFWIFFINICFVYTDTNTYQWDDEIYHIYTKDNVINDSWLNDPIRQGTLSSVEKLEWIVGSWEKFENEENRQKLFMDYVAVWINYILWLLAMIWIIFIIKDGIVIITSAWNEEKQKAAFKNIKNYIIAIIIIWTWYLIVNFVFFLVNESTKNL